MITRLLLAVAFLALSACAAGKPVATAPATAPATQAAAVRAATPLGAVHAYLDACMAAEADPLPYVVDFAHGESGMILERLWDENTARGDLRDAAVEQFGEAGLSVDVAVEGYRKQKAELRGLEEWRSLDGTSVLLLPPGGSINDDAAWLVHNEHGDGWRVELGHNLPLIERMQHVLIHDGNAKAAARMALRIKARHYTDVEAAARDYREALSRVRVSAYEAVRTGSILKPLVRDELPAAKAEAMRPAVTDLSQPVAAILSLGRAVHSRDKTAFLRTLDLSSPTDDQLMDDYWDFLEAEWEVYLASAKAWGKRNGYEGVELTDYLYHTSRWEDAVVWRRNDIIRVHRAFGIGRPMEVVQVEGQWKIKPRSVFPAEREREYGSIVGLTARLRADAVLIAAGKYADLSAYLYARRFRPASTQPVTQSQL